MHIIGSRKIFLENKNSLILNEVNPQLFIILILQNHFFSQIVLEPYRNQGGVFSGQRVWSGRTRRDKNQLVCCPFIFHLRQYQHHFYMTHPVFQPLPKTGVLWNLKDTSTLPPPHTHPKTGLAFWVPGAHTVVCWQLIDTLCPWPGRCLQGTEVCSLTHPPVIPFPLWKWQARVVSHTTLSPHLRPCQWTDFFSSWFIKQLMSKISELRETSHRYFISFSCFYSLFNMNNLSLFT